MPALLLLAEQRVCLLVKLSVFLRGDSYCFCKRLEVITVVVETAGLACFIHRVALAEQRFGQGDPLCGDVFINRSSRSRLEDPADVGAA